MLIDDRCQGFIAHWSGLRDGTRVPTLETFLDHASPAFAPYLFILDVGASGLTVRLQGTALVERWGKEYTGTVLYTTKSQRYRQASLSNFLNVSAQPCGCYMVDDFVSSARRHTKACTILLPLIAKTGRPSPVIGYSHELGSTYHADEHLVTKSSTLAAIWVDIGSGVPSESPQLPSD